MTMTMSWTPTTIATVSLVSLVSILATPAVAGRYCGDAVESGTSTGATQEEAVAAAQSWWSSRAGALGRGYESWDNAADQALECSRTEAGAFQCKATARPCLPEGMLPENVPKIEM